VKRCENALFDDFSGGKIALNRNISEINQKSTASPGEIFRLSL
jgi:hypothetical protein